MYTDDIVEIAGDERSSSLESSSNDDVPELESLLDQENVQPIPIPAPSENPPPYAVRVNMPFVPKASLNPHSTLILVIISL